MAFEYLTRRFARLIWVPGNHELWTTNHSPEAVRGVARYEALVELARGFGVLTPEDPSLLWPESNSPLYIVPLGCRRYSSTQTVSSSAAQANTWSAEI